MLDTIIILILVAGAFTCGVLFANYYNNKLYEEMNALHQYTEKLLAADKGLGYIASPVKKTAPVGQPFMDRLREYGHATQAIRTSKQS